MLLNYFAFNLEILLLLQIGLFIFATLLKLSLFLLSSLFPPRSPFFPSLLLFTFNTFFPFFCFSSSVLPFVFLPHSPVNYHILQCCSRLQFAEQS